MQKFSTSPLEILTSIRQNRNLLIQLTKRDIASRYKGSFFGIFWLFFNPFLMLTVYTFVFGFILKARWHSPDQSTFSFALILFAGLIIYYLFSEVISKSSTLIVNNANLVKKVIFPLEILSIASVLSSLFIFGINLIVLIITLFFIVGFPTINFFLLPFLLIPYIFFILGLSWLLSSIGVFVRDLGQVIGLLITVFLFLSPIFYPLSLVPKNYQLFILLSPISLAVEMFRSILGLGNFPNIYLSLYFFFISFFIMWFGFFIFQKSRKGFADVL